MGHAGIVFGCVILFLNGCSGSLLSSETKSVFGESNSKKSVGDEDADGDASKDGGADANGRRPQGEDDGRTDDESPEGGQIGDGCDEVEAAISTNSVRVIIVGSDDGGKSICVGSPKDLSNVVIEFADGSQERFEGLSGHTGTFAGTGENAGKTIVKAWIKSGDNKSGDGPGYGQVFTLPQ